MANTSKGIRHQWPDSAPPCSTSGNQSCSRCGLIRKAVRGTKPGPFRSPRFYWHYSQDGGCWSKRATACAAQRQEAA